MTLPVGDFTVTLHPELGKGTFGTVFRAVNNKNGHEVAVKKINYRNEDNKRNDQFMQMAFKEIKSTQKLAGNKNIIKFIEYQMDEHSYWIFMEYCEMGDLHCYLKKCSPDQSKKIDIMYQCACAIEFMHSREPPIIHRDIKTKNFLLKLENGKETVKVTDFGLAKLADSGDTAEQIKSLYMNTFGGTMDYMAPEFFIQDNPRYKASIDIFALGLVYLVVQQYLKGSPESDLTPYSVHMRTKKAKLSVGYEMSNAFNSNPKQPMPEVVNIPEHDETPAKDIKELIREMVVFESKHRLEIKKVTHRLNSILGDSGEYATADTKRTWSSEYMAGDNYDSGVESSIEVDQAGYKLVKNMRDITEKHGGSMNMLSCDSSVSRENIDDSRSEHFKRHQIVKLQCDPKDLDELQRGYGGFNNDMKHCIGSRGIVTGANNNGVRVEFINGKSFLLNPKSLVPVDTSVEDLEAGDYVLVIPKRSEVEGIQKQKGSGGWIEDMDKLLGKSGLIRCVRGDKVKVEHQEIDKSYVWNNKVLVLLEKGEDLLVHLMQQQRVS